MTLSHPVSHFTNQTDGNNASTLSQISPEILEKNNIQRTSDTCTSMNSDSTLNQSYLQTLAPLNNNNVTENHSPFSPYKYPASIHDVHPQSTLPFYQRQPTFCNTATASSLFASRPGSIYNQPPSSPFLNSTNQFIPPTTNALVPYQSSNAQASRQYYSQNSGPYTSQSQHHQSLEPLASLLQKRKRKDSRQRRQRTTFTSEQTLSLELEYGRTEYITRARRFELADILHLSETQVKIWFQNRRAKDKRMEKSNTDQQVRRLSIAATVVNSLTQNRPSTVDMMNTFSNSFSGALPLQL